ncbi:phage tail protein [Pseudomonas agarici]|uniref:phage tail protein n=1 Tax=Pseudomonas agarici TaxID=46677 RepID=UPI0015A0B8B9|nr:phage tail protein [Pseudomonas agarici]NWB91612.1 phage tail protein [Pseudomonas agarici]
MTDENSRYHSILTDVGIAKQAAANAQGTPWKLAKMGVGDAAGGEPTPDPGQIELINEHYRAPLNSLIKDPINPGTWIAELVIPLDVGGWWVRELGLYDEDNDLVAVANCPPSYKPLPSQGSVRTQRVRMRFVISNSGQIELIVSDDIVFATPDYVDQKILEELSKQDFKHSVRVATTAPITLSGTQPLDGIALSVGDRVLVKDQTEAWENGLYTVSDTAWARALDADSDLKVTPGLFVHVEQGTTHHDSLWHLVTDTPIALGSTDLHFEKVVGRTGIDAGTYRSISVDVYGRVIAGSTPTTLAEYAIELASQEEAEAQVDQDNTKPMSALRVYQAIVKKVVQATETVLGIAQVATHFQINDGTDDATIVTPKKLRFGFSASFHINGYIIFPSFLAGLTIQWTHSEVIPAGGAGAVYWPVAFPTTCVWASSTPVGHSGNAQAGNVVAGEFSQTAVDLYNWGPINSPARVIAFGV